MKTNNMNFLEAVQAVNNGYKVRRSGWKDGYIYKDNAGLFQGLYVHPGKRFYTCEIDCFLTSDWEIMLTTMSFTEAWKLLKEGKMVGRRDVQRTYRLDGYLLLCQSSPDVEWHIKKLSWHDIEATDWFEAIPDEVVPTNSDKQEPTVKEDVVFPEEITKQSQEKTRITMSAENLDFESCPFCGSTSITMRSDNGSRYFGRCSECHCDGPPGKTKDQAIDGWNDRVVSDREYRALVG
jgi:hypothetical protein